MARRKRVPVTIDPAGVNDLPHEELAAILRGDDEMIYRGGRTLLSKLLKGSREKKLL